MSIWVSIDGIPATEVAPHAAPTWSTKADGGDWEASWEFSGLPRIRDQRLRIGAVVKIMAGANPLWMGQLGEVDYQTGACVAHGLSTVLRRDFLNMDATLATTRVAGTAITQAVARGWPGGNPLGVAGTVDGDDDKPISIGELLDQLATEQEKRWGCDNFGHLYMVADPTTPHWMIPPGSAAIGLTGEGMATRVIGQFTGMGGGTNLTSVGSGAPEEFVDLTNRGRMNLASANQVLNWALRQRGRPQWLGGVEVSAHQLQTIGGVPAALSAVRAGTLLRAFGVSSGTAALSVDVLIGQTTYTAGSSTIRLEPIDSAPRTLTDVLGR